MKTILVLILIALSGPIRAADSATVSENRTISKELKEQLAPNVADAILIAPYDGYYEISGRSKRGNRFSFNRVKSKRSYPDSRWEDLAVEVTESLNFESGTNSVGSKTKASATAYVIFYKNGIEGIEQEGEGGLALVMIDAKNAMDKNMPSVKGLSAAKLFLVNVAMN